MGVKKLEILELEKFLEENKEHLEKYKNLAVTWTGTGYILKYSPSLEVFIQELRELQLSKEMILFNIEQKGFKAEKDYILLRLNLKNTKKNKVKVSLAVQKQAEIFNIIFDTKKECYVRIRNKKTREFRCYETNSLKDAYKLQAIMKSNHFTDTDDLMYSLNCYNNMYKATEDSLFSIQNLALDIDFDTSKITVKEVLKELRVLIRNNVIPAPTLIEQGHRLRFIYSIEDVAVTKKSVRTANKVLKAINDKIPAEFNSSVQALTTYARVHNTINTKNSAKVTISVERANKYTLRELQQKFLEKQTWTEKIEKANEKVVRLQNSYTLNLARLSDIESIQRIRQEGYRELLCYVYRNYCLLANMSAEEALRATKKFNSNFDKALREHELDSDTKHLNRKQYLHRNETLLELFDITFEEEKQLNLKTIISKKEANRRKKDRDNKRYKEKLKNINKISKKEDIEVIKQKIISLKKEKFKNKDIAEKLNITVKTLERYITNLRKQELL